MKKAFTILFALLVFLSVMHITIAVHICHGEISEIKVSLSGEPGSCGMNSDCNTTPTGFSNHCCENELSVFTIEDSYVKDFNQPKHLIQDQVYTPYLILSESVTLSCKPISDFSNIRPPGNELIHSVYLPFICNFRN